MNTSKPSNQESSAANPGPSGLLLSRTFPVLIYIVVPGCVCLFVLQSWRWPLVNDAAQLGYACFLMDHGLAPYRDLAEMNMPGVYLLNWTFLHTFGQGDFAWRCFDLLITGLASLALVWILRPYGRLAGVFAGGLFLLFHGRDGPAQASQRDLIVTMLLLWACSFIFSLRRHGRAEFIFLAGLCGMTAVTIKPVALPPLLALLVITLLDERGRRFRLALQALLGMAIPLAVVCGFLLLMGSLEAFKETVQTVLPYYAPLGRLPLGYLLRTCLTPSLSVLFAIALLSTLKSRESWNWELTVLLGGVAFGVLSFVGQGKGFAYHRYIAVGFLLAWVGAQFSLAMRRGGPARLAGYAGLVFGLVLAPLYTLRADRRVWDESFNRALTADLQSLRGLGLSGDIQCLATLPDCDTVLYRMQLVQASGLIYDFFVFGDRRVPLIAETRRRMYPRLVDRPPRVMVVAETLYPHQGDGYAKLETWPELQHVLATQYRMDTERRFQPAEIGERGYRVYVRLSP